MATTEQALVERGDSAALRNWLAQNHGAVHVLGPPRSGVSSLGHSIADEVIDPGPHVSSAAFESAGVTFLDGRYFDDDLVSKIKRSVDGKRIGNGLAYSGPRDRIGVSRHRLAGRSLLFETFGLRISDRAANPRHEPCRALFEATPGMMAAGPADVGLVRASRLPGADTKTNASFFGSYLELVTDRIAWLSGRSFPTELVLDALARAACAPIAVASEPTAEADLWETLRRLRLIWSIHVFHPANPAKTPQSYGVLTDPGLARNVLATSGREAAPGWVDAAAMLIDLHSHITNGEDDVAVSLAQPRPPPEGPHIVVESRQKSLEVSIRLDEQSAGDIRVASEPVLEHHRAAILTSDQTVTEIGENVLSIPVNVLWESLVPKGTGNG